MIGKRAGQTGSILMLVLFMCLGVAVVVQGLCAVVLCAQRAVFDEAVGRARLEEKDRGLATLRQRALQDWQATSWTIVYEGAGVILGPGAESSSVEDPGAVEGRLYEFEGGAGWAMQAVVRQDDTISRLTTSAWVERARDGIDLPLAGLVAEAVKADPGRAMPWMEVTAEAQVEDDDSSPGAALGAVGYVVEPAEAPLLGENCSLVKLAAPWRLDPGWLAGVGEDGRAASALAVAPGPGVSILTSRGGRTVEMPRHGGAEPKSPALVIVTGGADLDARNLGDLYGVIVMDDGSVLLDGTTLHGALFASGSVLLGETGQLVFSRSILRWATDRSLSRARLVPGSRWEGMEW
jgi:hypothetical protein